MPTSAGLLLLSEAGPYAAAPSGSYRPWLPTDLGTALLAWWDASDTSTMSPTPTNGAAVQTWTAKGGIGIVASQTTAASQPVWQSTGRNGKPCLYLNSGSSQCFSFDPTQFLRSTIAASVAGYIDNVGQFVGSGYWCRAFAFGDADDSTSLQIIQRGDTNTAGEYTLGGSTLTWVGVDRFVEVTAINNAGTLTVDGTQTNTGTFGGTFAGTLGFIGRGLSYTDYWPGLFQQIVVTDGSLTAAQQQQLQGWESWADGKNGGNLPFGHPYKYGPPVVAVSSGSGTTYTGSVSLAATPALASANQATAVAAASLAVIAAASSAGQLTAGSALTLAAIAAAAAGSNLTAAQSAALAQALGMAAATGSGSNATAIVLAAQALAAADAVSGQAALATIAAAPGLGAGAALTTAVSASLGASVLAAAQASLTIAAGTSFQASARLLLNGSLIANGTLTLPVDPALGVSSSAISGPSLAFTARFDKAAASTMSGSEAAQFAAQAAFEALLSIGDPYAGLPQLQGLRTVTLSLEGRRLGTRTLAGTVQVTLTLQGITRH